MKYKRILILLLTFITVWSLCQPFAAQAADSTSFNPIPIFIEAESIGGVPVGTVVAWPVGTNPADWSKWLECDGHTINAATYPELVAMVGSRVPDYRGLFLRGYGSQVYSQLNGTTIGVTSTIHQSGALGVVQGDAIRNIYGSSVEHTFFGESSLPTVIDNGALQSIRGATYGITGSIPRHRWSFNIDASRIAPVNNENRPANTAVRYLIRAAK
jgi:hypothetical protein